MSADITFYRGYTICKVRSSEDRVTVSQKGRFFHILPNVVAAIEWIDLRECAIAAQAIIAESI